MSNDYFWSKTPRMLTKLEVVDIHLLVMQSRPIIRYVPKKEKNEAHQSRSDSAVDKKAKHL